MPLRRSKSDTEYQEAASLLASGRIQEAIDRLRALLAREQRNTNVMVTLAVALMEMQTAPSRESVETEEALALLGRAGELSPKDPVPVFNTGVCLRKVGELKMALESFQRALKLEKKQPLALLHIAEINYELGNWEIAIEYARMALVRDPGLEGALGWVRNAMRKAGKLDDAGNLIQKSSAASTERQP
jgi:tetratricopeptide (TPR) repeat protein